MSDYHPEYVEGLQKIALDLALELDDILSRSEPGNNATKDAVSAYYKYLNDNSGD